MSAKKQNEDEIPWLHWLWYVH